jgi:hypothetical protein
LVDYAFDYSSLTTFDGVPPVGGGATSIGLGIQVNNVDDPVDEGIAIGVSPLIQDLPGDYKVSVEAFIYYAGGSGSSEHAVIGANADGTVLPHVFGTPGAGQFYHVPHNSGLTPSFPDDYYRVADGTVTGLYGDADQGLTDPETLGITFEGDDPVFGDAGYAGNRWFTLELEKTGNIINVFIEGVQIDSYDIGAGATTGEIVLGGADIYNSANDANWIIFDNFTVVPEPTSLVLLGLAGLMIRRR